MHRADPSRAVTYEDPTVVSDEDHRRHFGQSDHLRVYGRDLVDRLTRPGFTVETLFGDAAPGNRIFQATKLPAPRAQ